MSVFTEFFLARNSNVARLELLEFSHPSFSKTYYVVRNMVQGVNVTLPAPDNRQQRFDFYPVSIRRPKYDGTMDSELTISFSDIQDDIIGKEIERVILQDGFEVAPKVRYWAFRSDALNQCIIGPTSFDITNLPYSRSGFSAVASAPKVNTNGTGQFYTLERFPMLRGFL